MNKVNNKKFERFIHPMFGWAHGVSDASLLETRKALFEKVNKIKKDIPKMNGSYIYAIKTNSGVYGAIDATRAQYFSSADAMLNAIKDEVGKYALRGAIILAVHF
jgi:hypothetical protein